MTYSLSDRHQFLCLCLPNAKTFYQGLLTNTYSVFYILKLLLTLTAAVNWLCIGHKNFWYVNLYTLNYYLYIRKSKDKRHECKVLNKYLNYLATYRYILFFENNFPMTTQRRTLLCLAILGGLPLLPGICSYCWVLWCCIHWTPAFLVNLVYHIFLLGVSLTPSSF
jgi:hypothetical protein